MTGRRIKLSNVGGVAINTNEIGLLIDCGQFVADFKMAGRFVMTFAAGGDRNFWFQSTERRGPGDVDMTGRAFRYVLVQTMPKLHRNAVRKVHEADRRGRRR